MSGSSLHGLYLAVGTLEDLGPFPEHVSIDGGRSRSLSGAWGAETLRIPT